MKTLLSIFLTFSVVMAFSQQRVVNNKPYLQNGPGDANTISVTGLGSGLAPGDLVALLVGSGISYNNVSFTGAQGGNSISISR